MIALEHEAHVALVEFGAVLLVHLVDGVVEKEIFAGPGGIVHAEDVEKRGLPCPGRSHDGDEFAFFDFYVDATQDVVLGRSLFKAFFDVS